MHQAAPQPEFHRLQHLESGLYVRLTSAPNNRVTARLTARAYASRFTTHAAAAECWTRYIGPAPLEIVRS